MSRRVHSPTGLFDTLHYGFAQVVVVPTPFGDTVHVSGQVAWDADRKIVGAGDIARQLRKSLEGDDPEAIRSDIEALTQASHKLAELLYSQTAANPSDSDQPGDDQNQGGGSGSKQDDDNIVDAGRLC